MPGHKIAHVEVEALAGAAGLIPLEPFPGAAKNWRCRCNRCGREVSPRLSSLRAGSRCRYCQQGGVTPDEAEALAGRAGFNPLEPYPGSGPWRVRCRTCGQESTKRLAGLRTGAACRHCATHSRRVDDDVAAAEMQGAGYDPMDPYPGAGQPWLCTCRRCGRQVRPRLSIIRKGGGGCVYCSGRVVDPDEAAATMREAGLIPLEPYPGAGRWRCQCTTCGKTVTPTLNTVRSRKGGGCRYCAGRALDADDAIAGMNAAGFDPLESFAGAAAPWRSRCRRCGQESRPRWTHVRKGHSCAHCAGMVTDPGEAAQVMRAAGMTPLERYPGANEPWRVLCQRCGKESAPRYTNIRVRSSQCVYCAGRAVDPLDAVALLNSVGLIPLEAYPGSNAPWRCRCDECGKIVTPTYSHVRAGHGCRICNRRGIDFTRPGRVYVMRHRGHDAVKIGIATVGSAQDRVGVHRRYGWELHRELPCDTGEAAWQIEQAVLRILRYERGLRPYLTRTHMPQGGHTETFTARTIPANLLWEIVRDQAEHQVEGGEHG